MTSTRMAFAISTPTSSLLHSSSSSTCGKTSSLSNFAVPIPKNAIFHHIKCIPQLGFTPFAQWNGLRHMGISISQYSVKLERKRKCKGKGVYASLFGVGAPEALVIGVVALLVFGPKGLAEVARNLGKTLRAFQPTIRELQEVSREFKSTLEREIGLDDLDTPVPRSPSSNTVKPTPTDTADVSDGSPSESGEVPKDNYVKVMADQFTGALAQLQKEQEEENQEKQEKKEAVETAEIQSESQTPSEILSESQTPSEETPQAMDTPQEASSVASTPHNPDNSALQEAAPVASTGSAPKTEAEA